METEIKRYDQKSNVCEAGICQRAHNYHANRSLVYVKFRPLARPQLGMVGSSRFHTSLLVASCPGCVLSNRWCWTIYETNCCCQKLIAMSAGREAEPFFLKAAKRMNKTWRYTKHFFGTSSSGSLNRDK